MSRVAYKRADCFWNLAAIPCAQEGDFEARHSRTGRTGSAPGRPCHGQRWRLRHRPAGGRFRRGRGRGGSSAARRRPGRGPWARRRARAPCGCPGCTGTRWSSRHTARGAWPAPPRSTTAWQVRGAARGVTGNAAPRGRRRRLEAWVCGRTDGVCRMPKHLGTTSLSAAFVSL